MPHRQPLPPGAPHKSTGNIAFQHSRKVLRISGNPLIKELDDRARLGVQTLMDYLLSREYAQLLQKLAESNEV